MLALFGNTLTAVYKWTGLGEFHICHNKLPLYRLKYPYSIYIHCRPTISMHCSIFAHSESFRGPYESSPSILDFNDWRALQPMFDTAKLAGLFIVLRPGSCSVIISDYYSIKCLCVFFRPIHQCRDYCWRPCLVVYLLDCLYSEDQCIWYKSMLGCCIYSRLLTWQF